MACASLVAQLVKNLPAMQETLAWYLGWFPGEGIGYGLQYSWAYLVAQLVKNLPALCETLVRSLGWEDPLEKGKATHSSILAWRIPQAIQSMELQRFGHDWVTFTFTFPWWLSGKESTCQYRKSRFKTWVRKIPWRRKWQPSSVFLPGKSHEQRSLAGYSPWVHKRVGQGLATKQWQKPHLLCIYFIPGPVMNETRFLLLRSCQSHWVEWNWNK